ncbi:MAG: uroporphyrinogen-III synthase [Pseudomonadota bacterium]
MAEQALAGLSIVVTRPRDQAEPLARRIAQAGGLAILFPLLEIRAIADPLPLRALVARLHEFDLAIFISPNAAHYGMAAIRAAGELPENLKIATVGLGTAKALRNLGVAEIITPQDRFDSEALLALPQLQQVKGSRVVIFRGDAGRELLADTLRERGATVEYAACYRRTRPQHNVSALLAAAPDALTVTSSEALGYLHDMLDTAARAQLATVPLFVPHARIAAAARAQGWRDVTLTAAGDDGLLSGLVAWAKHRKPT